MTTKNPRLISALSLVFAMTSASGLAAGSLCPGHGVDTNKNLETGEPIKVEVEIDGTPIGSDTYLGFRCIGETVCFLVKGEDPDKDVCAPDVPVKAYVYSPTGVSVDIIVEGNTVKGVTLFPDLSSPKTKAVWTNGWTVPASVTVKKTPIELAGEMVHFQFKGKIDDVVCTNTPKHEPSANDTPVDLSKFSAKAAIPYIDVDIDSDNDDGAKYPERDKEEEKIEEDIGPGKYGKFIMVNQNDDDRDGIPDYADLNNTKEAQFVPLVVEIRPKDLDWSTVKLVFQYPGICPSTKDFEGIDVGNGFRDYRPAQKGVMRIWKVDDPSVPRSLGDFVSNGVVYTASDLGFSTKNEKTFWVEGISTNGGEKQMITVTLKTGRTYDVSDRVATTVVGPNLGVNNNENMDNKDGLRVGIPDVKFDINDDDDVIEDQRYGYKWWWARIPTNVPRAIVDLAPVVVDVPKSMVDSGFNFYLRTDTISADVFRNPSPPTNRLQYLQHPETAQKLLAETKRSLTPGKARWIPVQSGRNEFVFKAVDGHGLRECTFELVAEKGGLVTWREVIADSVKLTINDSSNFWSLASTRRNDGKKFTYPTEDDRSVEIDRYSDAEMVYDNRDPEREKYLVWVHGYNVNWQEAIDRCDEVWKRTFWLGFRGNFVGLTWEGDEGKWLVSKIWYFDKDVENAFQTSPAMVSFLLAVKGWAGDKAENVDVLMHSLGNLLGYDTFRLYERAKTAKPIARNVLGFEAAIWREAFEPPGDLNYVVGQDRYSAATKTDEILYNIDEQKHQSWRFWFRQKDHDLRNTLTGNVYHSYVAKDWVLSGAMRINDSHVLGNRHDTHYDRSNLTQYRGPIGASSLPYKVPALMELRKPPSSIPFKGYGYQDLTLPAGCVPNALANSTDSLDAATRGWGKTQHADYYDVWLPAIYRWYDAFLGSDGGNQQARIRLGEEK